MAFFALVPEPLRLLLRPLPPPALAWLGPTEEASLLLPPAGQTDKGRLSPYLPLAPSGDSAAHHSDSAAPACLTATGPKMCCVLESRHHGTRLDGTRLIQHLTGASEE